MAYATIHHMIPDTETLKDEKDPIIEAIVEQFLKKFKDIISKGTTDVGNTKVVQFKVKTTYEVPVAPNYTPQRSFEQCQ